MAHLYSPSQNAFYDTRIPYPELPFDVIDIGEVEHGRLIRAQSEGWEIYAKANGKPEVRKRRE